MTTTAGWTTPPARCGCRPSGSPTSVAGLREQVRELERAAKARRATGRPGSTSTQLAAQAAEIGGATILTAAVAVADGDALLKLADRLKAKLGDAAIVLGRAGDGRVDLIASVAPSLVGRGVKAGEIIKLAAAEVGGGGGGRDTMARAGGRDPERLDDAISAARGRSSRRSHLTGPTP